MPASDPVGHTLYDGPSVLSNVLFASFAQRGGAVARQVSYPLAWNSTGVLSSQKHLVSQLYFDQRPAAAGKPATVVAPSTGDSFSTSLNGLVDADGSLAGGQGVTVHGLALSLLQLAAQAAAGCHGEQAQPASAARPLVAGVADPSCSRPCSHAGAPGALLMPRYFCSAPGRCSMDPLRAAAASCRLLGPPWSASGTYSCSGTDNAFVRLQPAK
jgi:hypothetical protein